MLFFIDHCVPRSVVEFLNQEGHKTNILKNHLPPDAPDERVIQKAQKQNAILISLNGDFADIVTYPPQNFVGIIGLQVRNRPEAIEHILHRLNNYFQKHPDQEHYSGKLILVEPHRIRVRKEV